MAGSVSLRAGLELAGAAAVAALIIALKVEAGRAQSAHLELLNVQAAADTTRHFYAGQLQVATRLIVQRDVQVAAALRLAHSRPTAAATITIYRDTSRATTTGTSPDTGTYRGEYHQDGVSVVALVTPPVFHWTVATDPIPLQIALSCGPGGSASATVAGPRWANARLDSLEQAPGVCNPPPAWSVLSFKPPSAVWAGILVGVGYLLGRR